MAGSGAVGPAWPVLMAFAVIGVAGCGPSARDMPLVIEREQAGAVVVLFPTCQDGFVKSVKVYSVEHFARWDVPMPVGNPQATPAVEELVFAADGFDVADHYPEAHLTSDPAQGPISVGFDSLSAIDIWTDEGEAYLRVEWLHGSSATRWVLAEIPYKDGDVVVEEVTLAEGRARLLAWCEE